MKKRRFFHLAWVVGVLSIFAFVSIVYAISDAFKQNIYKVGTLKPVDSVLKVKVGDRAPDFTLPSISEEKVSLSHHRGKKNVVLSFVPAAWTPVC
jgi:peroxiredoxin (alkyl hydroperoxide reductase subunit C)